MKRLCVFCGSSSGTNPKYLSLASELGEKMAQRQIGLVYGGASIGLMGKVADEVLNKKGIVIGVIPESLTSLEIIHRGLTEQHVVQGMHERKKLMYDFSDAFVAIPGGMGTLDEMCEILTWAQLKYHQKPCYILNTYGFYDALLSHFNFIHREGFLKKEHLDLVRVVNNVDELLDAVLLP
jgi:uncharacterized protein (TIGR00730 family)